MNPVSAGEFHGLRVVSALVSIVAGCIIIGVFNDCDADAVGGIFLGAGGLGLVISVYPFIQTWLNFHHFLPTLGNLRIHPAPVNPTMELPAEALRREATQSQLNLERTKSRMGALPDMPTAEPSVEEGPSSDVPDIIAQRKPKQSSDIDVS
ncbi:kinocilin [Conger conger]|uniref:kinocilin n=1 Tax=Conger conger TaxID=82655 RepID=UPI002A5B065A|nr:kinocilin [Conger conger]